MAEHNWGSLVVLFVFFSLLLGSLLRHAVLHFRIPIPYTVLLLLLGIAWGVIGTDLGLPGHSIELVANISPSLLLEIFLPALIFESAFSTNAHIMSRGFGQALLLAGPGILLATALTAAAVKMSFSYNWNWPTALMFGAMVSATDPVAVVALLREVGASKRLSTLIEAESLLNDGTAFVLFIILNKAVTTGSVSAGSAFGTFIRLSIGGPLLGILLGFLSVKWLNRVHSDARVETSLTIFVAYLTFWIAELPEVEVSGVLAVVFLGLYMARNRASISPDVEQSLHHVWEMISFIANTIIFLLSGAIVADNMMKDHVGVIDFVYLGMLYVFLHLIRGAVVAILYPIIRRQGYGLSGKDAFVLVFGGLRGAVGLALGLFTNLEENIDHDIRDQIMFQTSGVVLLTLLVNATTLRFVLSALGMDQASPSSILVLNQALRHLKHEAEVLTNTLKQDLHFAGADWHHLSRRLPRFDKMITETNMDSEDGVVLSLSSCASNVDSDVMSGFPMETELRMRFLSAMKAAYWAQFEEGMTSKSAVTAIVKATDRAMDNNRIADVWDIIAPQFEISWWLRRIYEQSSGTNPFINRLLFRQLAFAVELGTAFQDAARRIEKVVLSFPELGDVHACSSVSHEMSEEVTRAQEAWIDVQRSYPEIYRAILTRHAARFIIHRERHTVQQLYRQGLLDDTEQDSLISVIDERSRSLRTAIRSAPSARSIISELPFLSSLPQATLDRVRRAFQTKLFSPGEFIYRRNCSASSLLLVRRGLVNVMVDDEVADTIGPGAIVGAWSMRSDSVFLADAVADSLVEAFTLDRSVIEQLCQDHKSVSDALWRMSSSILLKTFFRDRFLPLSLVQLGELAADAHICEVGTRTNVHHVGLLLKGTANADRAPLLLNGDVQLSSDAVVAELGSLAQSGNAWMGAGSAGLFTTFHCEHAPADTALDVGAEIKPTALHLQRVVSSARIKQLRSDMKTDDKDENLSEQERSYMSGIGAGYEAHSEHESAEAMAAGDRDASMQSLSFAGARSRPRSRS